MEIICMGQAEGKKSSKFNTCLKTAGFQNMLLDLSLFCTGNELENKERIFDRYIKGQYSDEGIFISNEPERLEEAISKYHLPALNKNGWSVKIAKAPFLLRDSKRDDLYALMEQLAIESMKVSKKAGAEYIIVEPLPDNRNKEFFLALADKAKELEIKILIKNCYDSYNGHFVRGTFADGYSLAEFIDRLNQDCGDEIVGLCMDVGVCNVLGQNMYEFTSVLRDKIKAVVLRENDGVHDSSMLPFTCADKGQDKMDWLNLMRGLRAICFDGMLVVDFRDTMCAHSHLLWSNLAKFAFETIKYIEWQLSIENTIRKYDMRVLFGAGNMCRAYMKCYGQEFPPLFTCDNNEKIWGTTFEGLTIKNPEELKNLPGDCAIFICNIYYDEIEEQLRGMDIKNPIERFNDEFMPSCHFDRIDAETREIK